VSETSIRRVLRGYEAFNSGDLDSFLTGLGDDFEVVDRPDNPDATVYRGAGHWKQAMVEMREAFAEYRFDVDEVDDRGDHIIVVAHQSARGKASGVPVEGTIVHVWEVRDDQAIGMRAYSTRDEALAAEGLAD
jgi:ketosteroid isomerase-like protein